MVLEHETVNFVVGGSNPSSPALISKKLFIMEQKEMYYVMKYGRCLTYFENVDEANAYAKSVKGHVVTQTV